MRSGGPAAPTRRRCGRRCRRPTATRACSEHSMRRMASRRASASASIRRAWWCACTRATARAACCMSAPSKGSAMEKFVPIQGLHHWAYRCRDAEETRHFYEDLLGMPLTHFIREDEYTGSNGARLELTTVSGSAEQIAEYPKKARAELDAWTREKRKKVA